MWPPRTPPFRHPDYAPSIFSFKVITQECGFLDQDASPAVSNLARLSRAESRRKRHRDEVESNRLAKTPRMETICELIMKFEGQLKMMALNAVALMLCEYMYCILLMSFMPLFIYNNRQEQKCF